MPATRDMFQTPTGLANTGLGYLFEYATDRVGRKGGSASRAGLVEQAF